MPKKSDTNEDLDFELEDSEESAQDKIKKIREKLKACQEEKQDYLSNWQKERADFLNYKKEDSARAERLASYSREEFAGELLPVLDSYDMAFANREAWEKVDKNWRVGVEYIHAQLLKVMADYGVAEISPKIGELFNQNLHQPMETIITENEKDDQKVDKIIQKGYKMGDKIIRPARVAILEYKQNI